MQFISRRDPARVAALSSRGLALDALADFRTRESWGRSRGGVRKWRTLAHTHAGLDDFLATCVRVCAALDALLGSWPGQAEVAVYDSYEYRSQTR